MGWNVKFCTGPGQTEASSCRLQVGLGGDDSTHQDWTTWHSGDPVVVQVPNDFTNVDEIWVKGIANPRGRNVLMSLRFNNDCVKKMRFDHEEEHEQHQNDRDDCDC